MRVPLYTEDGQEFEGDGLLVYRAGSLEEARRLADSDPLHQRWGGANIPPDASAAQRRRADRGQGPARGGAGLLGSHDRRRRTRLQKHDRQAGADDLELPPGGFKRWFLEVGKPFKPGDASPAADAAAAALRSAELDLSYTRIYAPIDGRVSRTNVNRGDLVGPAGAAPLATVVQDQPIYAFYNASNREVITTLRKMGRKRPDATTGC